MNVIIVNYNYRKQIEGMENEQELRNIIAENKERIEKQRAKYLEEERLLKIEENKKELPLLAYILPKIEVESSTTGRLFLSHDECSFIRDNLFHTSTTGKEVSRETARILAKIYSSCRIVTRNIWVIGF